MCSDVWIWCVLCVVDSWASVVAVVVFAAGISAAIVVFAAATFAAVVFVVTAATAAVVFVAVLVLVLVVVAVVVVVVVVGPVDSDWVGNFVRQPKRTVPRVHFSHRGDWEWPSVLSPYAATRRAHLLLAATLDWFCGQLLLCPG